MTTISQLLETKGGAMWTVAATASAFDALRIMADKNVGALLVMDGERLAGILSERDYARKVVLKGHTAADTRVRDIMTTDVIYAQPDYTVEQCMAVMTDRHFRHLPVMEGDRLVGLVSIGDLVKSIIATQQFTIDQLEQYISGGG